jgi:hypothetical protein
MHLVPKSLGYFQSIDVEVVPPGNLNAGLMKLPVMAPAQWDCKFFTNF